MSDMLPAHVLDALAKAKNADDVQKVLAEYAEVQKFDAVVETCFNKFSGVDREKAVEFVKSLVSLSNDAGLYISGISQQNSTKHQIGFEFDDMSISLRVTVKDNK